MGIGHDDSILILAAGYDGVPAAVADFETVSALEEK